jgi:hypothetical protein
MDAIGFGRYESIAENHKGKGSGSEIIVLDNPGIFGSAKHLCYSCVELELGPHVLLINIFLQVVANFISSWSGRVFPIPNIRRKLLGWVLVEFRRRLD